VDPTGMWGDDEYGTKRWAQDVGFSEDDATIIANANMDVVFTRFETPLSLGARNSTLTLILRVPTLE